MNETRKILIVEGSGRGFLSHYSHALALGLHEAGHQVRLVTAPCDELSDWRVPFERHATLRSGLSGWRDLVSQTRSFAPEIIHFQWLSDPISAAFFVRWAQGRGAAVLYTPHNLLPHRGRWMTMPLFRRLYGVFDRIIVRDEAMRWAANEMLDVDLDRMSMAPGSPNIIAHPTAPRSQPSEIPHRNEGEIRAVHFGHGCTRKGLAPMLDALARTDCPPNLHLVLAGSGVTTGIAPQLLHAVRRRVRVSVINRYLAPAEVGGLFHEADLITMPYAKLCRSPILDLAAAFRLPVLRTHRVEATQFAEGQHGITIRHGNFADYARELANLARAPGRLHAMQRALRSGPDFMSDMAALARRHDDIYNQSLDVMSVSSVGVVPHHHPLVVGE